MSIAFSAVIGYLMGCLSPSAYFSKKKKRNLRKEGTGNLGATNTMLVLGKKYGVFVMFFDIFKAFFAMKLMGGIFPRNRLARIVAGGSAVVGHVYPVQHKFKGGKGLASFGGFVLGLDPVIFLGLLIVAIGSALVINYTVAIPVSAGILLPFVYGIKQGGDAAVIIVTAVCIVLLTSHIPNLQRAIRGEEIKIRDFFRERLSR